jgi:hypothetical protein
MRARLDLNGEWQFWPDIAGRFATNSTARDFLPPTTLERELGTPRHIHVPGAWQAQFSDLRLWWGTCFYRREFDVPEEWNGKRMRLCFGAVDYFCSVWINGEAAGSHEGGYLPFDVDVTGGVHCGAVNDITVEVRDPGPGRSTGSAAPFDFADIPHGKQSWYGPIGGIWQDVCIEATAPTYIRGAGIIADPSTGELGIDVSVDGSTTQDHVVVCDVEAPDGSPALRRSVMAPAVEGRTLLHAAVDEVIAWQPRSPALYRLRLRLASKAGISDQWADEFGFRSIRTESGRILLNDRPLYLRGALDQDYYAGTICTPPSEGVLARQIMLAKEMGLNLLRCHIKVPDPRYLRWADRLGMLVWLELPNWQSLTPAARRRALETLKGMIERDRNHPCVIAWTIINESWGVDLSDPEHRTWLAEAFSRVKEMDPTRLVVDNSASTSNFHIRSDLNDFHLYRAQPDHHDQWRDSMAEWANDPAATFGPGAEHGGWEPLVLSEFGHWGLPDLAGLVDEAGHDPWWFDTGRDRDEGAVWPKGARDRFESWGLGDVFGSWAGLAAAAQELQYESLKFEIEDLRRHPSMAGYVITEFTDVHWECNGLLDHARDAKRCHDRLKEVNGPDAVVLTPDKRRYWSGERASVEIHVSHYSRASIEEAEIRVAVAGRDVAQWAIGRIDSGIVLAAGAVELEIPAVEVPEAVAISASLVEAGGSIVARNDIRVLIWPRADRPSPWTVGERIGEILLADSLDEAVTEFLSDGGKALLIVTDPHALNGTASLRVAARAGTRWQGDWAQGLHWLHPSLLGDAPLPNFLSMVWCGLVPRHVLLGYEPRHASDLLAGYFVGWIRHVVPTIARYSFGAGAGIVTTFPLLDHPDDPLAAWLLDRLVHMASAPSFPPYRAMT